MTRLRYGTASDVGLVRSQNQDSFGADGSLFVVADGLGGHRGGEVAAEVAVDTLLAGGPVESLARLFELVHEANDAILARARNDPSLWGMCTTLCALADLGPVAGQPRLALVNIGDSRLYAVTESGILQLTADHSIVAELVRAGRITASEAEFHVDRHILTRALGMESEVLVDGWEVQAGTGSHFLICSDGLHNELDEDEIVEILHRGGDPAEAAGGLVEAALQAGGRDNVTVVVVKILEGQPRETGDLVISTMRSPGSTTPGSTTPGSATPGSTMPTVETMAVDTAVPPPRAQAVHPLRRLPAAPLALLVALVLVAPLLAVAVWTVLSLVTGG